MASHRTAWAVGVGLGVLAFLLYLPSLGHQFIWDDQIVLQEQLPRFAGAAEILLPPPGIPRFSGDYYRPLTVLSYLADQRLVAALWPPEAFARGQRLVFHLTPVALHALMTVEVVAIGLMLGAALVERQRLFAAAAGGLLFAVHPVHVESVAWMAGRSDVLCGVFFLAAMVAVARYRRSDHPAWFAVAASAALGAALAKETGLAVLPVAALMLILLPRAAFRASGARRLEVEVGALFATAVPYFVLRSAALGSPAAPSLSHDPSYACLPGAVGWYVVKTLWTPPSSPFVEHVPGGVFALIGVAALAGFAAALVWVLRTRRHVPAFLAAAVFVISLAPALAAAAFPLANTPLAERYLYIPSAGACLLAGLLLASRPGALVVVPLLAALYGFQAVRAQALWSDNVTFWSHAAVRAPEDGSYRQELAKALIEAGRPEEAEQQYGILFEQKDEHPFILSRARNDRGVMLLRQGRLEAAIGDFERAAALDPAYAAPHLNLGMTLLKQAAGTEAEEASRAAVVRALDHFAAALRIDPGLVVARFEYGALLVRLGRRTAGEPHLREVIRAAPLSREAQRARQLLGDGVP